MDIPIFAAKLALRDRKVMDNIVHDADVASANALDRLPKPERGRFEVRFTNGIWTHFDRRYVYHIGAFPSHKAADAALGRAR